MSNQYDIGIIGGGPAGLAAAMTARVRNKKVVLFEPYGFSDKLQKSHLVANYPGMPNVSGKEMMDVFVRQAEELGTEILREKVQAVYPGDSLTISTMQGNFITVGAVIIATGIAPAKLYEGEEEFLGRGVSYCATCDAMMYKGQEVAVFGLEPEAPHEAEFLAEVCQTVHYFPLLPVEHEFKAGNIKVHERANMPKIIYGSDLVEKVVLSNDQEIAVSGVFILRQATRLDALVHGLETEKGAILTDEQQRTNLPGVFAAGDCTGKPWQIPRAVGEGNIAALAAVEYLTMK
ncbi:MAG: FAD-dependent oxidoreductase [Negativicutes bacterium]|nr:FAD-dependent oxidoreductase [Negativicutes bacterium]